MRNISGKVYSFDGAFSDGGNAANLIVSLQGCPLRCLYCNNPSSWFYGDGTLTTTIELFEKIASYKKGTLTITGGEPLMQADFCAELIKGCQDIGFATAIDTSGAVPIEKSAEAIYAADIIVLDIKDVSPEDCEVLTGADNLNTMDTLDYCQQIDKPTLLRYVLLPGYTMTEEKLRQLGSLVSEYSCVRKLELIPYNPNALAKWATLGISSSLKSTPAPTEAEIIWAEQILRQYDIPI